MRLYGSTLGGVRAFGAPLARLRLGNATIWEATAAPIGPQLPAMTTIPTGWVKLWDDGFAGSTLDQTKWFVDTVRRASNYSTDRVAMIDTDYGSACQLTATCTDGNFDATRGGGKIITTASASDLIVPPVYVAVWFDRHIVFGSKISYWFATRERGTSNQSVRGWLEFDCIETGAAGGDRRDNNRSYESPPGTQTINPGFHIWQYNYSGGQYHTHPPGWKPSTPYRYIDAPPALRAGALFMNGSTDDEKTFTYYYDDVEVGAGGVLNCSTSSIVPSGETERELAAALWGQPRQLILSTECLFGSVGDLPVGRQWMSAEWLYDYLVVTQQHPDPVDFPIHVPIYRVELWVPPGDPRLPT